MSSSPSTQPPPAHASPERVADAIKGRWLKPAVAPADYRVAAGDIDSLAKKTLDTMLTRQYRVTPFPNDYYYGELLRRVRHWVSRGQPIRIRMGHGPMKNLNTTGHNCADWAEYFALCHLCSWHNKIAGVYPPGLRMKLVFDDSTIVMANRHNRREMTNYIDSIWRLVQALKYDSFIVGTMRQSSFAWLFHFGLYQLAGIRVRRWERDPANAEALERMTDAARRNVVLPAGLSEEEQEKRLDQCSHRYRVYCEALHLSGLPKLGNAIVGTYLDGKQHHCPEPPAFHLTSLGKGQMAQPWQGEGALSDNGHGKLVPCVLTAGRRASMNIVTYDGLDIVPVEGFDSIQVGFPQQETPSGAGSS